MSTWSSIISNEIQNGRPVVYWAFEDAPWNGAHTFVCDGYNSVTGLFHFNWGHTINGIWCSIDNIVEGTGMHWTRNECAIIGIQPGGYQDFCYYNLSLDNFYQYFYLNHNPSIYPPYSVVSQTSTILTSASASSSASWRTIPYGAVAKYQAHVEINLEDGYEAEAGSEFEAEIVSCGKCDDWRGGSSTGEPSTNYSSVVHETKQITDKTAVDFHDLFPNPTDGELTMNVEGTVESIVVYNLQGQPVGGWHMLAVSDGSVTIDVRPLRSGTYLLCVRTTDGKVTTGRFVRK